MDALEGQDEKFPVYGSGCYRGLGHDGMIESSKICFRWFQIN